MVPHLEAATSDPEPVSAQAERPALPTAEDALTVLRQASQPLGPMGAEWVKWQERDL